MIKERVNSADLLIKIIFKNNTSIELKLLNEVGINKDENIITNAKIVETLNVQNSNPVGVISSNTLKLDIRSNDKSLIPDNENSPYFGLMNESAYIDVSVIESGQTLKFGRYFVNKWYSLTDMSNKYKVNIECTDIISILSKNLIPDIQIRKKDKLSEILKNIMDKINNKSIEKYKVIVDQNNIKFPDFDSVEYYNISVTNMSDLLNTIAQSTLTNIYINRNNEFICDYVADDTKTESVGNIDENMAILSAQSNKNDSTTYTGVKTNYFKYSVNKPDSIGGISEQALEIGDNQLNNIVSNGNIYKLNYVSVIGDNTSNIVIKELTYNKNKIDMLISASEKCNCEIDIFGQSINENQLYETLGDTDSDNTTLEVTNRLIDATLVKLFNTKLLKVISLKNSKLQIKAFLDPRAKLGDIVYINTEKLLGVKGYYKIYKLEWEFDTSLKCNIELIKVFEG